MDHKELTSHIRNRIKAAGIKAKCKMSISCGNRTIRIDAPAYDVLFTEEQQREIRLIAKCNRLKWVRGLEIDIEQMTNPHEFAFYMQEDQ